MSKKKKAKAPELYYETTGDVISSEQAYRQAASLLDLAAVHAVQSNDMESVSAVAHQWMEMAVLMSGEGQEVHEHSDERPTDRVMGFGSQSMREVPKSAGKQD